MGESYLYVGAYLVAFDGVFLLQLALSQSLIFLLKLLQLFGRDLKTTAKLIKSSFYCWLCLLGLIKISAHPSCSWAGGGSVGIGNWIKQSVALSSCIIFLCRGNHQLLLSAPTLLSCLRSTTGLSSRGQRSELGVTLRNKPTGLQETTSMWCVTWHQSDRTLNIAAEPVRCCGSCCTVSTLCCSVCLYQR